MISDPERKVARAGAVDIDELLGPSERRRRAFEHRSDVLEAAALIREMRTRAGLSQAELAERLGTHQSHISEIERGNGPQGPTFAMLKRIARACGDSLAVVREEDRASAQREAEAPRNEAKSLRKENDRLRHDVEALRAENAALRRMLAQPLSGKPAHRGALAAFIKSPVGIGIVAAAGYKVKDYLVYMDQVERSGIQFESKLEEVAHTKHLDLDEIKEIYEQLKIKIKEDEKGDSRRSASSTNYGEVVAGLLASWLIKNER